MNANFLKYVQRNGAYSQHWLIRITGYTDQSHQSSLRFANNNEDVTVGGETYTASAFDFTPNPGKSGFDGGGTLEITTRNAAGTDNGIYSKVNGFTNTFLSVTGVLDEHGEITPVKTFSMQYGTVSGDREKITFNFDKDDRLNMTFPALVFSHYNNRGN